MPANGAVVLPPPLASAADDGCERCWTRLVMPPLLSAVSNRDSFCRPDKAPRAAMESSLMQSWLPDRSSSRSTTVTSEGDASGRRAAVRPAAVSAAPPALRAASGVPRPTAPHSALNPTSPMLHPPTSKCSASVAAAGCSWAASAAHPSGPAAVSARSNRRRHTAAPMPGASWRQKAGPRGFPRSTSDVSTPVLTRVESAEASFEASSAAPAESPLAEGPPTLQLVRSRACSRVSTGASSATAPLPSCFP
mmetsp:Transcript_21204/g.63809  ORF Transcript_21204/g.63809 Transcript_21204/m.63809 type:complete len:250 (+) Transcript_21204:766-1515(+)